jgi:hypothetical protein
MRIFGQRQICGLLSIPRLSVNETERLFPVADGGQRAHDFRDDRSCAVVIGLRLWGKAVQRVGASFGGCPIFGSLRERRLPARSGPSLPQFACAQLDSCGRSAGHLGMAAIDATASVCSNPSR